VQVVEGCRKWKNEILSCQSVLGISSIHGVAGEGWGIAEIFHAVATVPTGSVRSTDPGNTDARSGCQRLGAMYNFADDLVAGNYISAARRKFSFHDMQIGSADTTRVHAQQNMTR
jgi:hypothetical protein